MPPPACPSATLYSTQEDPIGLAGGLYLYGYAGGDPINYSDPFGLMVCDPPGTCPVTTEGVGVLAIFGAGPLAEIGRWSDGRREGNYLKLGWGVGLDVSVGASEGKGASKDAVGGYAAGACVGLLIGSYCKSDVVVEPPKRSA